MRLTQGLCRALQVNAPGIATIEGERQRTWQQVGDRVARLSAGLCSLGLAAGERIAILAQNSDVFYETYFAILWGGGVVVPLNTRLARAELAFQLQDAGVRILLFGREFAPLAADLKTSLGDALRYVGMDGPGGAAEVSTEALIEAHAPARETVRGNADLAGIFYTGGTTGIPKGVMLSHANLASMATNLIMSTKIDESCVNLHSAPMFHLADIGTFMTTMVGGTHVFARRLDEQIMLQLIERHRVTHCFTVPAVIDRMARHPSAPDTDVSSLRLLGYGGAPMPTGTWEFARAIFPNVEFVQGFGSTEMAAHTFLGPQHHRPGADPEKLKSAGQTCFGYELKIVGANGEDLPPRQVGEIVGRGDNVMQGYWNRPEETAKVLRDGWLYTQDAGYLDEQGFVYITDRLKDMIISGGENVYSIEVENAVSRHPAVKECTVIGVPDAQWGERVHVIAVLNEGEQLDLETLRAFCRDAIAGYKCPKSLEIRPTPLPRSPAGKVLKKDLRLPYWADRTRGI